MSFRIRSLRGKTVFQYEGVDGMVASWPFEDGLEDTELVGKLEGVLRFIRSQTDLAPAPSSPPDWRPEGQVRVLPAIQLPPARAPQAPPLEASIAQATANGWELYSGDDD